MVHVVIKRAFGDVAYALGFRDTAEQVYAAAAIEDLVQQTQEAVLPLADPARRKRHVNLMDYANEAQTPEEVRTLESSVAGHLFSPAKLSEGTVDNLTAQINALALTLGQINIKANGTTTSHRKTWDEIVETGSDGRMPVTYTSPPQIILNLSIDRR